MAEKKVLVVFAFLVITVLALVGPVSAVEQPVCAWHINAAKYVDINGNGENDGLDTLTDVTGNPWGFFIDLDLNGVRNVSGSEDPIACVPASGGGSSKCIFDIYPQIGDSDYYIYESGRTSWLMTHPNGSDDDWVSAGGGFFEFRAEWDATHEMWYWHVRVHRPTGYEQTEIGLCCLQFGNTQTGCLDVTKDVDWAGVVPDTTLDDTQFIVNVTGPYGYEQSITFDYQGNALPSGSNHFEGLITGQYEVDETLICGTGPCIPVASRTDWIVGDNPQFIWVNPGETCPNVEVNNTYNPGCLEICKKVDWDGVAPIGDPQFRVCLDGTCQSVGDGDCATFDNLTPGSYDISEEDPGTSWMVAYPDGTTANVAAGDICGEHKYNVTNTRSNPCLNVTKYVNVEGRGWDDANSATGPTATLSDEPNVQFKAKICNCGNVPTNLSAFDDATVGYTKPGWGSVPVGKTFAVGECAEYLSSAITVQAGDCNVPQKSDLVTITPSYKGNNLPTDDDPAHFFVACPHINVTKEVQVNGGTWYDADDPTGPQATIGDDVTFRVKVCNDGNVPANLTGLDDTTHGYTLPGGDQSFWNSITSQFPLNNLGVGLCTAWYESADYTVAEGDCPRPQKDDYLTIAGNYDGIGLTASDVANFYVTCPCLNVTKQVQVNGGTWYDADDPAGPQATLDDDITFRMKVCNCGNVPANLTGLDDFTDGYTLPGGDQSFWNSITSQLPLNNIGVGSCTMWYESADYTVAEGDCSQPQKNDNITIAGNYDGIGLTASNEANFYVACPCLNVTKKVQVNGGTWYDANDPTGPTAAVGDDVKFRVDICNCGNVPTNLSAFDDATVGYTKPGWGSVPVGKTFAVAECQSYDSAVYDVPAAACDVPQKSDVVTITPSYKGNNLPTDSDPANFYVACPCVNITKQVTNDSGAHWYDADSPFGPTVAVTGSVGFQANVCNCGNVPIDLNSLTDDVFGDAYSVTWGSLPATLAVETCTGWIGSSHIQFTEADCANGPQFWDNLTVAADYQGTLLTDSDLAHFYLQCPCINVTKYVKDPMDGWLDANIEGSGPSVMVPEGLDYKFVVENCGNVNLTIEGVQDLVNDDAFSDRVGDWYCDPAILPSPFVPKATFTCYLDAEDAPTECGDNYDNVTVLAESTFDETPVSDADKAWYEGLCVPCLNVTKEVAVEGGTWYDADSPTGPTAMVGDDVKFRVKVCNCGNVLANLTNVQDVTNGYSIPGDFWSNIPSLPMSIAAEQCTAWIESRNYTVTSSDCAQPQKNDTVTISGTFRTVPLTANDPANFYVECPKTEWCGLTQGFWKENIDKYRSGWSNGRQVCDEFFETVNPGAVCDAITTVNAQCDCSGASNCTTWGCLYEKFNMKDTPRDRALLQMIAMDLTMQYHVPGSGDFYIDCSKSCGSQLGDLCDGSGFVSIEDVWARIVDYYTPGGTYNDVFKAQALADCINNYNDGKCSPDVQFAHCDPATFDGLQNCAGTKNPKIRIGGH